MTKKIKLNKAHRDVIQDYRLKHIASTIDRAKEKKLLVSPARKPALNCGILLCCNSSVVSTQKELECVDVSPKC